MGVLADCQRVVRESSAGLGGLDIIISNAVRQDEPKAEIIWLSQRHRAEGQCLLP